jgi:hypothetical protein
MKRQASEEKQVDQYTSKVPLIERAFMIARSGSCRTVVEIRSQLRAEGYGLEVEDYMTGRKLCLDLRRLCDVATAKEQHTAP